MVAELKKRGYKAYITAGKLKTKTAAGKLRTETFYRVRVGRYDTRQEAMVDLRRLPKTAKYKNAMMIIARLNLLPCRVDSGHIAINSTKN